MAKKSKKIKPDPEQAFNVTIEVIVPGFGRKKHHAQLVKSVARAVHYRVSKDAQVFYKGKRVMYDVVLDEAGNIPECMPVVIVGEAWHETMMERY